MSDDVIEFPELKKVSKKRITIFDEELALIYDMTPKQKVNYLICLVAFLFIVGAISLLFMGRLGLFDFNNVVEIKLVSVISYDLNENTAEVYIQPDSEQVECTYINEGKEIKGKIKDNKCYISVELGEGMVSFVNKRNRESDPVIVDDYVLDLKVKDKYYLPLNYEMVLADDKLVVGEPKISWISLSENVQ